MAENEIRIKIQTDFDKSGSKEAQEAINKIDDSVQELGKSSQQTTENIEQISPALEQAGTQAQQTHSLLKTLTGGAISGFSLLLQSIFYILDAFADLKEKGVPVFYTIGLTLIKTRENLINIGHDVRLLARDIKELNFKAFLLDVGKTAHDIKKLTSDLANWNDIAAASFERVHKLVEKIGHAAVSVGKHLWEMQKNEIKDDFKDTSQGIIARTLITGLAAKAAVQLEKSFSAVKKVLSGTDEEIKNVDASIRALATNTIPLANEELNTIAASGATMGLAAKELPDFTTTVAEDATAFEMLPDEAGKAFGALKNIYNLNVKELSDLSDQINYVGDNSNATERDIINILTRSGEAAKNFGLMRGEAISLASAMLALGKPPEVAATAINNLLTRLQDPEGQTKEFLNGLQAIGLSADELKQKISTNAGGALDDFLARLNRLNMQSRTAVLGAMFGAGGDTQAISSLVSSLDELRRVNKLAGDASLYAGSAHKTFLNQTETADSKIILMTNALKNLGAAAFEPLIPVLNTVSDSFRGFFNTISAFATNNPVLVIFWQMVLTVTSFAGVTRLLGLAFGFFRPYVIAAAVALSAQFAAGALSATAALGRFGAGLITTQSLLGRVILTTAGFGRVLLFLIGGPIGAAILAVTSLVAIYEKYKNELINVQGVSASVSDTISAAWQVVSNKLKSSFDYVFGGIVSGFGNVITKLTGFKADWSTTFTGIADITYFAINGILRGFDLLFGTLSTGLAALAEHKLDLISVAGAMADYAAGTANRDYLKEFTTATAEQIKANQAKSGALPAQETKAVDNGLSVSLPGKDSGTESATKAKALIKEKLDAELAAIKTKQQALKETADLEEKQLEANLKAQELSLKQQVEAGQLTQIEADEKLLALKKSLADRKLAIEKELILKTSALENEAINAKINAVKAETTTASTSVANLDSELAKAAKKYGFNLDAVQAKFKEVSEKYGISESVLKAQAYQESRFNPNARSGVGAVGFSQFMPDTAKQYGLSNRTDPIASIEAQARLMSDNVKRFGDVASALAAYNGGGKAAKYLKDNPQYIQNPDYSAPINTYKHQTADYVKKITGMAGGAGESPEATQERNAKLEALNQERVQNEQQTNAKLKALGIDQQNAVTQQGEDELNVKKEKTAQEKALFEEKLSAEHAAALDALALQEQQSQFELDQGLITQEQQLANLRVFAAERLKIEQKFLDDKRELLKDDVLALAQNQSEKEALLRKFASTEFDNLTKEEAEKKRQMKEALSPLENAIDQAVNGVLNGQQTLKNAAKNAAQSVVVSYASAFVKKRMMMVAEFAWEKMQIGAHWLWETLGFAKKEAKQMLIKKKDIAFDNAARMKNKAATAADWLWETLGFTTKETTKATAKAASENAQTGAQIAGDAERTTSAVTAAATEKAAHSSTAKSSIMESAASAAGNVYDSVSQIPYVGWILAPIAAAATFIAVAGYTAYIGSAKGGEWNVGNDGAIYELHKNESVLPEPIANPMRQFFSDGAAGKFIKSLTVDPEQQHIATIQAMVKSGALHSNWTLPQSVLSIPQQSQQAANRFASDFIKAGQQSTTGQGKTKGNGGTMVNLDGKIMTAEEFLMSGSHVIVKAGNKEARKFNVNKKR